MKNNVVELNIRGVRMRPLFGWNKISKVEVGLELLSMTMRLFG